jgi:hypothetical protein
MFISLSIVFSLQEVLIKHLAQLLETSPQKQKGERQKQLDVSFFLMSFHFLYIFISLQSYNTVYILQSLSPVKETPEIETGMAESPAGTRQTYSKN